MLLILNKVVMLNKKYSNCVHTFIIFIFPNYHIVDLDQSQPGNYFAIVSMFISCKDLIIDWRFF